MRSGVTGYPGGQLEQVSLDNLRSRLPVDELHAGTIAVQDTLALVVTDQSAEIHPKCVREVPERLDARIVGSVFKSRD